MQRASPDRRPSLAQRLVLELSQKIVSGEWPAGSKLPTEQVLTEAHGVSRTTVREALSRLQAEGLVETRRGIGTFVVDTVRAGDDQDSAPEKGTACDAVALIELRLSLEVEAAAIAAQRATPAQLAAMGAALADAATPGPLETAAGRDFAFNLLIAQCTGNSFFIDAMSHLGSTLMGDAQRALPQLGAAQRARWQHEREQVLVSITRKDADGARAAMRLHLVNLLQHARSAVDAQGD
ncbi:GntR family transcriptional regulator [Pseudomonas sp. 148P]|uniref:GntR family transcriptional regulator n=1 Tax=Pseudomonas ulcerans TaxID=3115852 RepID=A0ABU7HVI6_9PSED|nr:MULTISPECIES: GntR family transcriptional regulator [unclassified Pseudomonas]MEE1924432.1 GntR family transcriptional regulator [Pseudomonas sp. 147P]MEE1935575.1 GntR family transcriptional regulator [Pseudomonas sp. 148P]